MDAPPDERRPDNGFPQSPDDLWGPPDTSRRDRRRGTDDNDGVRRRPREDRGLQEEPSRRRIATSPSPAGTRAPANTGDRAQDVAATSATGGNSGHSRRWLTILTAVGVVVVLVVCGLGAYFMINNDKSRSAPPSGTSGVKTSGVKARDISTRDVDPATLTEQEVFPAQQITAGTATYRVLKTQATDCPSAATEDLAKLLGQLGCSQVVRGTLKSPDGQFLITAGIFNLKDEASANQAYDSIKPALEAQKGRFTGLPAGDGTEAIVRAPTTLGWHPRGHFLVYCIVARVDGKPIAADDPASKQVISDLVETHLRDRVIGARAVVSPGPTAKPGG
jgi:hypothetical protein